jgi:protein-L-isoaspartate(D-aspartate) O-methyltransferase
LFLFEDTFKLRGRREQLVRKLQENGIRDARVLEAFRRVKRHAFIESAFVEQAYEDGPLPIGQGQTISQPYTVAYQTQLLQQPPGSRVLEIGTGSGYQCAILLEMGYEVYSIERNEALCERAQHILAQLGYRPHLVCGDGSLGWPEHAPYDAILVTAAAPEVPPALLEQLAQGGRMVIPVGGRALQTMWVIERDTSDQLHWKKQANFKFVPLVGKSGWASE